MKKLLAIFSLVPLLAAAQPALEQNTNFNAYWTTNGSNMVLYVVGLADENVNWQAKGTLLTHTLATNAAATGTAPDNTLLVSLRFPEGSGTATTNDGSGQTFLAQVPSWVSGKSGAGYALRFNGSSDRVVSTNNITYNTNIITISLWMQLTNVTASDKVLLESSPNYFSNADTFLVVADDSTDTNKMYVVNRGTTSGRREETFNRPTDNQWHHLVVTIDASTEAGDTRVWLDKVSQSTTVRVDTKTGTSNFSAQYLYVAARNAGSLHLNCTLDDVRIYGGELSSDEILYLYNNPQ